jgi:cysteine desulfurase
MKAYLDNAATTSVSPEVLEAMLPYFKEQYGNPSSLHTVGIEAKKTLNACHKKMAHLLGCKHTELHITSGGTESSNWALKGLAFGHTSKSEIITTRIEHHATLHTVEFLESLGYIIHYLDVDQFGFINIKHLESLLNENTLVVSIIYANNEIGTIQNINKIAHLCQINSTYLHLDAVQALTHIPLHIPNLHADLISFSGHKFHAPKGIGLLYVKEGLKLTNLLHGGQQEQGHRSGTENLPYIVGMTKALEEGIKHLESNKARIEDFSAYVLSELDKHKIDYRLNGPSLGQMRLPGNLNLSFKGLDGSDLTYFLNKKGIAVSTGSACDSTSIEPSHVLKAIQVPQDYIDCSIRISIGDTNTFEEVVYATKTLIETIKDLQ